MNYYPGDIHTCDHCGARYEIHEGGHSPYRDEDSEKCVVCGEVMAHWNSTSWPKFELIKKDPSS